MGGDAVALGKRVKEKGFAEHFIDFAISTFGSIDLLIIRANTMD